MKACNKTIAAGCLLILAAALQTGCATTPKTEAPSPKATAPINLAPQQSDNQVITGKIAETMDSGGYTYVNLEKDGKRQWVAIPATKVEVGQELKLLPGMQMGEFTSSTLKRTFDNIIFSAGVAADAAPAPAGAAGTQPPMPSGHPAINQMAQLPQGHPSMEHQAASKGSTLSGKVVETMNSGGYTYINLEKDGKKKWVAVPTMQVSVGQELELRNGAVMTNFTSKTLNRTFDSIIFSAGPVAGK